MVFYWKKHIPKSCLPLIYRSILFFVFFLPLFTMRTDTKNIIMLNYIMNPFWHNFRTFFSLYTIIQLGSLTFHSIQINTKLVTDFKILSAIKKLDISSSISETLKLPSYSDFCVYLIYIPSIPFITYWGLFCRDYSW